MNLRKVAYFSLSRLRGFPLSNYYERFLREERDRIPSDTSRKLLVRLLEHCKQSVPYYAKVMHNIGNFFCDDPEEYLRHFPILTKEIIRNRFDELKSTDLARRKWHLNSSGGSTGEPVQFIQDREYRAQAEAITLLYSKWVGNEIGGLQVRLWGSERDILQGNEKWRTRLLCNIINTTFVNAFSLDEKRIREFIAFLNAKRPKLIIAYAQSIYEVARFCERECLEVIPQEAIITSAETLHSFMREKIERVFRCRVFNRYGSRELGDIACERPGWEGLWVAPWGNYVEIVDGEGNRVPDGTQGEILVTSLTNYAMPLVRYRIGDIGILSPPKSIGRGGDGQVLQMVLGRITDTFKTMNGTLVYPGYFAYLLFSRDWVSKFQIIQKSPKLLVFKIVKSASGYQPMELDEISAKTKLIMGGDCEVVYEFVDEIVPSRSGKYRYEISEVDD
ncbi:MAG: hypothetical protein A2162_08620 [Deltaproteobacteria bacterium RBG_13_52_11b]|nr:MAG: hypothetical protein A2162_08620 [Deltaproteobacteria bacterium RBG_13_52_11b]